MSKHPRTDAKVREMIKHGRDPSGLEFYAGELEMELNEAKERERVAIASWDEERLRALREAARLVVANKLLDEAFSHVRNIPLADDISRHLVKTGAIKYL